MIEKSKKSALWGYFSLQCQLQRQRKMKKKRRVFSDLLCAWLSGH